MRKFLLLPIAVIAGCTLETSTTQLVPEITVEQDDRDHIKYSPNTLNSALKRTRDDVIRSTDPKTANAFWVERDLEIDAVTHYISNCEFPTVGEKLRTMVITDQSLRLLFTELVRREDHFLSREEAALTRIGLIERLRRIDEFNTETLKSMLEGREWFRDDKDGKDAAYNAWLIVQHADRNPEFQRTILPLIEAALGTPGTSNQNYAYLHDRIAIAEGRPQLYGTQGRCVDLGIWEPYEIIDEAQVDIRRADMDLDTVADNITRLKDRCVIAASKN